MWFLATSYLEAMAAIHLSTHMLFPTTQVRKTQQRSTLLFLVFLCQRVALIKIIFQRHNPLKSVQEVQKKLVIHQVGRDSQELKLLTQQVMKSLLGLNLHKIDAVWWGVVCGFLLSSWFRFVFFCFLCWACKEQHWEEAGSYFTVSYKQRSGRRLWREEKVPVRNPN